MSSGTTPGTHGEAPGDSTGEAPEQTRPEPGHGVATTQTVEQVVRKQLAQALGGGRGMLEAAIPTIAFTVLFITLHDLRLAIMVSVGCAGVLLAVRLVQHSTPQFVLNALFGIGIGALFAWRAGQSGGDAGDQALAYFLPGLLYNLGYAALMIFTIAIRWPVVGFIVGSVAGRPRRSWQRAFPSKSATFPARASRRASSTRSWRIPAHRTPRTRQAEGCGSAPPLPTVA